MTEFRIDRTGGGFEVSPVDRVAKKQALNAVAQAAEIARENGADIGELLIACGKEADDWSVQGLYFKVQGEIGRLIGDVGLALLTVWGTFLIIEDATNTSNGKIGSKLSWLWDQVGSIFGFGSDEAKKQQDGMTKAFGLSVPTLMAAVTGRCGLFGAVIGAVRAAFGGAQSSTTFPGLTGPTQGPTPAPAAAAPSQNPVVQTAIQGAAKIGTTLAGGGLVNAVSGSSLLAQFGERALSSLASNVIDKVSGWASGLFSDKAPFTSEELALYEAVTGRPASDLLRLQRS